MLPQHCLCCCLHLRPAFDKCMLYRCITQPLFGGAQIACYLFMFRQQSCQAAAGYLHCLFLLK